MNQDLYCSSRQDHGLDKALDQQLIVMSREALDSGTPVRFSTTIANVNRTVGTMLGARADQGRMAAQGLPDGTIDITFDGSAGNSFGAFVPRGHHAAARTATPTTTSARACPAAGSWCARRTTRRRATSPRRTSSPAT